MRATLQVVCVILCTSAVVTGWPLPKWTQAAVVTTRLGTGLPPTGSAGILPQTWVAPAAAAPQVDGKLDEAVWQLPRPVVLGKLATHGKTSPRTEARLVHHVGVLYVAVRLDEPNVDQIKRAAIGPDGPAWEDDSVERFLSPEPESGYFQFIFSAGGGVYDRKGHRDPAAFNAGAKAAVQIGETGR